MSAPKNTLRTFALVCVAMTSIFVMGMSVWLTQFLADPAWCDRAIGAAKDAAQRESAFGGCFSLLMQQMSALAVNSYIYAGVIALCLGALMVIVIAGGRVSFRGPGGIAADIGGNAPPPPVAAVTTTTTTSIPSPAPPVEPTLEDTP